MDFTDTMLGCSIQPKIFFNLRDVMLENHPTIYPRYPWRTVHRLDGLWDFASLGAEASVADVQPESITFNRRIDVPSAYDAYPDWAGQRGLFAYRTTVPTEPGRAAHLRLHGAGMWHRLLISDDGGRSYQCIEDLALPYSGISVELPPAESSERHLLLLSDNRFDFDRVPLLEEFFDFYAYGGLFRSVDYHEAPTDRLERAAVRTLGHREGRLGVDIRCASATDAAREGELFVDGVAVGNFTLPAGADRHRMEITLSGLAPWSPESPALHELGITLGDDRLVERFGLRQIEVRDGALFLNDRPVRLRGVCRHEAHPEYGPALPWSRIVQDVQLIRASGCNFVRGAHYPQDPRFLDLCDEVGLLVFEESLGWQQGLRHFHSAEYGDACERQTRLMVRNSINHPSVILWGFLNEGESHRPESEALYRRLTAAVKEEDDSRPLTYASNHPEDDLNFDLADVISLNIYPGWYAEPDGAERPLGDIVPRIRELLAHLAASPETAGKPVLISEIGAGALYGWHDLHRTHWSEEYQSDLLEIVCREVVENQDLLGVALWQFCDGRTYANPRALTRPRAFNNKGLFDEYRRPKLAAETVKRIFREAEE